MAVTPLGRGRRRPGEALLGDQRDVNCPPVSLRSSRSRHVRMRTTLSGSCVPVARCRPRGTAGRSKTTSSRPRTGL